MSLVASGIALGGGLSGDAKSPAGLDGWVLPRTLPLTSVWRKYHPLMRLILTKYGAIPLT
jgi:hypothetical protein